MADYLSCLQIVLAFMINLRLTDPVSTHYIEIEEICKSPKILWGRMKKTRVPLRGPKQIATCLQNRLQIDRILPTFNSRFGKMDEGYRRTQFLVRIHFWCQNTGSKSDTKDFILFVMKNSQQRTVVKQLILQGEHTVITVQFREIFHQGMIHMIRIDELILTAWTLIVGFFEICLEIVTELK